MDGNAVLIVIGLLYDPPSITIGSLLFTDIWIPSYVYDNAA